ncbi:glutamate carrier 1 domain protein [Ancylostoma ceylanicum]|uniref:Glutamate carrier 1 domain protein n=1 Tax=Ancylostoma ceylanicum TaxID=53326 RepID=A0A0D6MAE5_9BILA|nr:glutamate carrier 1 domain protein [Ancylostoma ceylanicum]
MGGCEHFGYAARCTARTWAMHRIILDEDCRVVLRLNVKTGMGGQEFSYVPKIMNGGLAGIVGVTCVFPIDLVKTRLQNQPILANGEVQYKGIADCAKQTWRSGGVSIFSKVRALYSGSAVNIVLITPEKAIKLVANDFFRHHLAVPGEKTLSAWRGMAAGGLAGMFQIIVTTPMELLKIQMQDQGRTAVPGQKKMTALELTSKLLKERGIAGLYKRESMLK